VSDLHKKLDVAQIELRLFGRSDLGDAIARACTELCVAQAEVARLQKCRDELQEATEAVGNIGVNLVCTLPESIRALRRRAEAAEYYAGVLEEYLDTETLRHAQARAALAKGGGK
jgi:hypothetical protein